MCSQVIILGPLPPSVLLPNRKEKRKRGHETQQFIFIFFSQVGSLRLKSFARITWVGPETCF